MSFFLIIKIKKIKNPNMLIWKFFIPYILQPHFSIIERNLTLEVEHVVSLVILLEPRVTNFWISKLAPFSFKWMLRFMHLFFHFKHLLSCFHSHIIANFFPPLPPPSLFQSLTAVVPISSSPSNIINSISPTHSTSPSPSPSPLLPPHSPTTFSLFSYTKHYHFSAHYPSTLHVK